MADTAFKQMAQSLARCVNRAMGASYMDNVRAEIALGLFLDENARVFETYDQLHPGVARDPQNVAALDDRIRREVALATMTIVHITDGGEVGEGNWKAKIRKGSIIALVGPLK